MEEKDVALLKFVLGIQSLAMILWVFLERSPFGNLLFSFFYFEDQTITFLDILLNMFFLTIPIATNFKSQIALALCGGWIFLLTLISFYLDSKFASPYLIGAYGVRYLLPISILFQIRDKGPKGMMLSHRVLKWGIGLTFIFHGLEAIKLKPVFLDYLAFLSNRFLGMTIPETTLIYCLIGIGIVDIMVGGMVFKNDHFLLYFYLFLWGFLTALIRPLYEIYPYGVLGLFLRITHFCVPLYFLKSYFNFKFITLRKEEI